MFFVTQNTHRYISNKIHREEGGTPDIVGSIRVGLCFQRMYRDLDAKLRREASLVSKTHAFLQQHCPKLVLLGCAPHRKVPIFSFLIKGGREGEGASFLHHNFVARVLNDVYGIQCRGGCMCAGPYAHRLLGMEQQDIVDFENELLRHDCEYIRPGFTRFSFSYLNSDEEVDFVLAALAQVCEYAYLLLPLYTFHPKTGEWTLITENFKFPQRKWLKDMDAVLEEASTMKEALDSHQKPAKDFASFQQVLQYANQYYSRLEAKKSKPLPLVSDSKFYWFRTCSVEDSSTTNVMKPHLFQEKLLEVSPSTLPTPAHAPSSSNTLVESLETQLLATQAQLTRTQAQLFSTQSKKERKQPLQVCNVVDTVSRAKQQGQIFEMAIQRQNANLWPSIPHKLYKTVVKAVRDWDMIRDGDRLVLGLSGGKDSLSLLHVLLKLQKTGPVSFTLATATVDPGMWGWALWGCIFSFHSFIHAWTYIQVYTIHIHTCVYYSYM